MRFAIQLALFAFLPSIAQVTGTLVSSADQPLAGCEVKLGASVVLSDAGGAFRFDAATAIAPAPADPERRLSNRFGLQLFDMRGRFIGLVAGNRPTPAIPLRKGAAADSAHIKCPGFALLKVPVAGANASLGKITVSIPDGSLPGIHVDYNPYADAVGAWYKVISHSHTVAHGGNPTGTTPDKIAQAYKDLGMHAVALTDHDALTKPAGIAGILYLPGEEVTTNDGDMNVFGINKAVAAGMTGQKVIDAAILNGNGFTQVNHPLDSDANDDGRLLTYLGGLKNLWGIEVYNGGRLSQDATAAWDHLISQGKRVWATAGDDAHSTQVIDDGTGIPETGRKWIVVNSREKTADGILAGMRAGRFYASEGPEMDIKVQGDVITVSSAPGNSLSWFSANRKLLKKVTLGASPESHTLTGTEVFVRVLIADGKGKRAISQPIFTK